ncbi:MAG TPA: hypothetical protein ENK11_07505 [Phycisphaerales bacterium]|nr:hypothetical protein [Phycisphaerales bacterium]
MSDADMKLPVLEVRVDSVSEFIVCWSRLYHDPLEALYTENIGHPLTPSRIDALFRWKNGGKISEKKADSIHKHYHTAPERLEEVGDHSSVTRLLESIGGGGVIWGIFMLHIWRPARYPIYDQHVHRAMRILQGNEVDELEGMPDQKKREHYIDDYMPFWKTHFSHEDHRTVDKALWAFGKAMKRPSGAGLNWFTMLAAE